MAAELKGPVAHHFNNMSQQITTVRFGMWLFLVTEVLFFGGAFCAYTAYRIWFPRDFEAGSAALNVGIASVNTMLLLASSLTITLAIRSVYIGSQKGAKLNLMLTILLGSAFLGLKAREYYLDYEEGLIPNISEMTPAGKQHYEEKLAKALQEVESAKNPIDKAARGSEYTALVNRKPVPFNENLEVALHHVHFKGVPGKDYEPQRVQLFFMFYYSMTGLHVLHMIIGIGLLIWQYILASTGFFNHNARYVYIEVMSLYWHFVDMVWMFLLPLLYLAGPHTAQQAIGQFKDAISIKSESKH